MKLSRNDFRTGRRWRSGTGMTEGQFDVLHSHFCVEYHALFGSDLATRQADNPQELVITSEEDLLLFTLFSLKSGLTYDLLGITCGMDGGTAHRVQTLGLSVLQSTLYNLHMMPIRSFTALADFEKYFEKVDILLLDVTEQRTERPSDYETQKRNYSGKKKHIQLNHSIFVTRKRKSYI
jgi:hypothetical protein